MADGEITLRARPVVPKGADEAVRAEIATFLTQQEVMDLATASADGIPMAHGMHYVSDGLVVYTSSLPKTKKLANIAENPIVGYTVYFLAGFENRENSRTLQMKGRAREAHDPGECERVHTLMHEKYPWSPPGTLKHNVLIRIDPIEALWSDFSPGAPPRQIIHFEDPGPTSAA